jgi:hypothetical protein
MSGSVGIDGGIGGIPQGGLKYPGGPNIFPFLAIMFLHFNYLFGIYGHTVSSGRLNEIPSSGVLNMMNCLYMDVEH